MPPDSSCGYCLTRRAGLAMPTRSSSSTAHARAPRLRSCPRWRRSTSAICVPTREQRVERGHRVLEDHRDLVAADALASVASASPWTSDSPFQRMSPPVILPGSSISPINGLGGDALARAGLADEAERLAAGDREADVAHRLDDAAAGEERRPSRWSTSSSGRVEAGDVQPLRVVRCDRSCALPCRCRADRRARRSASRAPAGRGSTRSQLATRLTDEHGEAEQQMPGIDDQPPGAEQS